MRYWDSSALLPLLVQEKESGRLAALLEEDSAIVTWWATRVECVSALARLEREGSMTTADVTVALGRLRAAAQQWSEVPPTPALREHANRLLRTHPLRAGDALQLAAAIVASDAQPAALEFITLDARQRASAEREGFRIVG